VTSFRFSDKTILSWGADKLGHLFARRTVI